MIARLPGMEQISSAQGMGGLFLKTVRAAVRPPYRWSGDCVEQCAIAIRRCFVPLVLSISFFAIGLVVTTIADVLETIGSIDRFGGVAAIGWPRETAYWVTGMVFAGVVGAAVTADLGSRKIRDELDAVVVLGVDPIRALVVPRVVALVIIAPILGMVALFNALLVLYLLTPLLVSNFPHAVFLNLLTTFMTTGDIVSFVLRLMVSGLFVGIVACYKGLSTKGGAEGVGRAVNQTVVITFLGIWLLNSIWNAVFLAAVPSVTGFRG
jgi:phospholipid/cholesterol/gamma-HCH transport system permease protein